MNHIAQLASVQGENAKDLGSIPRSQTLFMFFFNRQSSVLHAKGVHHVPSRYGPLIHQCLRSNAFPMEDHCTPQSSMRTRWE